MIIIYSRAEPIRHFSTTKLKSSRRFFDLCPHQLGKVEEKQIATAFVYNISPRMHKNTPGQAEMLVGLLCFHSWIQLALEVPGSTM